MRKKNPKKDLAEDFSASLEFLKGGTVEGRLYKIPFEKGTKEKLLKRSGRKTSSRFF